MPRAARISKKPIGRLLVGDVVVDDVVGIQVAQLAHHGNGALVASGYLLDFACVEGTVGSGLNYLFSGHCIAGEFWRVGGERRGHHLHTSVITVDAD